LSNEQRANGWKPCAMTETWRPILQQLITELERQSVRMRELEAQRLVDLSVSLNGGAHRRSMASIEHVDSPKRQVTDVTSASIEEEEAQPTEVWAEKTEEAIQHENSEKTEKSQDWRTRMRNRASTFDFSSFRLMRATKTTRSRPGDSVKKKPSYIINPQTNNYAYWQLLTTCALGFVVIVVPFQVGLLELEWDVLMIVSCVVDLVFVSDMVVQFFTMYPITTARGVQWEDSLSKIAKHYLRTWFPVDLLTVIPFDIIELSSGVGQVGAFKGTKAVRALRLLKLMRVLKNLKWLHKFESAVSIPYQQFALVRFIFVLLIVCHWQSCVWAMTLQLSDPLATPKIPTWIDDVEASDATFGIDIRSQPMRTYLTAFYFCSYTMTSVGYGDIFPRNILERVVCTIIILTAGLCWAYVLGEVCAIVSDMNEETQAFRKKMTDLNTMMWEQGLPYELRRRLRSFFLQNRHQALHVTRQRLRESMSPQLQSEVCIALNLAWLRRVTFFTQFMELIEETEERGLDTDPFRMCIADVSRELDCGAFAQGERFENVQCLFILSKGLVALNSRVISGGAVWGEDFVLSDINLIHPVRGFALTYLEVLFLTRQNFMKVIERRRISCPQLGQIVRKFTVRLAARRGILQHAKNAKIRLLAAQVSEEMAAASASTTLTSTVRSPTHHAPPPPRVPEEVLEKSSPFGSVPGQLEDF